MARRLTGIDASDLTYFDFRGTSSCRIGLLVARIALRVPNRCHHRTRVCDEPNGVALRFRASLCRKIKKIESGFRLFPYCYSSFRRAGWQARANGCMAVRPVMVIITAIRAIPRTEPGATHLSPESRHSTSSLGYTNGLFHLMRHAVNKLHRLEHELVVLRPA